MLLHVPQHTRVAIATLPDRYFLGWASVPGQVEEGNQQLVIIQPRFLSDFLQWLLKWQVLQKLYLKNYEHFQLLKFASLFHIGWYEIAYTAVHWYGISWWVNYYSIRASLHIMIRTPGFPSRKYWVSLIKKQNKKMANRTLNFEAGNGNWWR